MDNAGSPTRRLFTATLAVAGTYAYFLIFPQFAFLHALRAAGMTTDAVRILMGIMAVAGVTASLVAGKIAGKRPGREIMAAGAILCAAGAALFATISNNNAVQAVVAALSGAGLGLLTVSLAASLREWCGERRVALTCGLGTGLAYGAANIPAVFKADPASQSRISVAAAILVALALIGAPASRLEKESEPTLGSAGFRWGVALFLLLIWLDSACFAIIQETDAMRHASWGLDADLIANGLVHLFAAAATGLFFKVRHLGAWLLAALSLLTVAALLLGAGGPYAGKAHTLYAAGVSVYSTLLVAWAPLAHGPGCARRVAVLYSLAGWFGSAMGIGMALDLHRIPWEFLALAVAVYTMAGALGAHRLIGGKHPHA